MPNRLMSPKELGLQKSITRTLFKAINQKSIIKAIEKHFLND